MNDNHFIGGTLQKSRKIGFRRAGIVILHSKEAIHDYGTISPGRIISIRIEHRIPPFFLSCAQLTVQIPYQTQHMGVYRCSSNPVVNVGSLPKSRLCMFFISL